MKTFCGTIWLTRAGLMTKSSKAQQFNNLQSRLGRLHDQDYPKAKQWNWLTMSLEITRESRVHLVDDENTVSAPLIGASTQDTVKQLLLFIHQETTDLWRTFLKQHTWEATSLCWQALTPSCSLQLLVSSYYSTNVSTEVLGVVLFHLVLICQAFSGSSIAFTGYL